MGYTSMTYKQCFERGLLRKATIENEEILHQLEIAENYIKKAESICRNETFDMSFLASYISIFHSARALLYTKGYKERSHFCLFEFIRNEFKNNKEIARFAEIGQNYRETRHKIQYDGSLCSEDSAKEAIDDAKEFLKKAKILCTNKQL